MNVFDEVKYRTGEQATAWTFLARSCKLLLNIINVRYFKILSRDLVLLF